MHSSVIESLRCPLCHGGLSAGLSGSGQALGCGKGHSFDTARQGYVNLAYPPPAHSGDNAGMVAARAAFLEAGHYRFIAEAVSAAANTLLCKAQPQLIVEAGAGTGYYLSAVLDALPDSVGLALDVSKAAARRAAKAHPRLGAALCDVWREVPVQDAAAGLVLSIFAPRNGAEFARVLHSDGALIVVAPTSEHLHEAVGALGLLRVGANKEEAVSTSLGRQFIRIEERHLNQLLHLSHEGVRTLVDMGPSAWHVDPQRLAAAIGALPEVVPITASVTISSYRLSR